jgi:HD-like signal output (HDOD) protein/CheY-like chemotaxis protein
MATGETGCRIVFVDDDPLILDGLRRMLNSLKNDWQMTFVESGAAALDALARTTVDVIVTDMRMPAMDGATLLERVKNLHPGTIRLILSGHGDLSPIMKAAGVAHQYLSKPCDAETLKATIKRARALNDLLHSPRLLQVVGGIRSLPTLPAVYQELVRCLRDPDASLMSVANIVQKDAGMSAMMLKLVNSAFFGMPQKTHSVQRAVSLLGVETVLGLVLSYGLFAERAGGRIPSAHLMKLQAKSELAAAATRCIARLEGLDAAAVDQAYVAALMQEIGTLVLAAELPDQYANVLAKMQSGSTPLAELETAEFGASHAEVGGYLLGLWGLPNPVVEGVAFHEAPTAVSSDPLSTAALVHIGERLASAPDQNPPHAAPSLAGEDPLCMAGVKERWPTWLETWRSIAGGAPS